MLSESHYLFYSHRREVCASCHADAHTQPSWSKAMATAPLALFSSYFFPYIPLPFSKTFLVLAEKHQIVNVISS